MPNRESKTNRALIVAAALLAGLVMFPGTAYADTNCGDFKFQEDAQKYFDEKGYSADNDPEGLDSSNGRGDGVACESLPHRPADKKSSSEDDSDKDSDDKDSGNKDSDDEDKDVNAPAGSQARAWPRGGAETGG